ncbi:MAG TPA: hypothetical protein VFQ96_00055 [Microbacteriaceae bacterium]|nr:hypothetical protein [Microbacteriaceae bacterium]
MGETVSVIVVTAAFAACVVWMVVAWRHRLHGETGLLPALTEPGMRGAERLFLSDLGYVVTTLHDKPFERLAIGPLAYPGRADLAVHDGGIALRLVGADEVFVPAASIVSIGKASWALGRAVEKDGMVVVEWICGDGRTRADSYLRVLRPGDDLLVVRAIAAAAEAALPGGAWRHEKVLGDAGDAPNAGNNEKEIREHQHG